jgi:hypothetical protein
MGVPEWFETAAAWLRDWPEEVWLLSDARPRGLAGKRYASGADASSAMIGGNGKGVCWPADDSSLVVATADRHGVGLSAGPSMVCPAGRLSTDALSHVFEALSNSETAWGRCLVVVEGSSIERADREQALWCAIAGRLQPVRRWRGIDGTLVELARPWLKRLIVQRATKLDWGTFHRTEPLSRQFGYDRGQPIDRVYIESFLAAHAEVITGRVLEVGDDTYTWRFGAGRMTTSDVLHVSNDHPRASLVADLADVQSLPEGRFDCIICTQTLHLVYAIPQAVAGLHRLLAPGGTALVTVPGITPIDRGEWRDVWCWSFTPHSLRRAFSDVFGPERVEVQSHGNVLAAAAFLYGVAAEELSPTELEVHDEAYPVTVTAAARKAVD